jgi:hypothetical protein
MKSRWITHKGRKILYADYAGFKNDSHALLEEMEAATCELAQQSQNSTLLLIDLSDTDVNAGLSRWYRSAAPTVALIHKEAVVGMTGLLNLLYKGFVKVSGQKNTAIFDDVPTALDWLSQ